MTDLTWNIYLDAKVGAIASLPKAGTTLEHPYVYDAAARDMMAMADQGLIEVVDFKSSAESAAQLIDNLRFRRLR